MTLHFNFLKKGKAMKSDNENNLFAKLVYGDLSEVQALLESEIHPDEYKDEYGNTALFNTLFLGDLKRAKLLLTHNSSPNIKDNYGQTILDKLVSSNSMDKMEFLLQNTTNIDLEIKNNYGFTPLYSSVLDENIAAMELLLKFGADINSKDSYEMPVLNCAINNNKLKAAELLLKYKANPNAQDNGGWTLLYCSVFNKIEAAKLLIKYGADVNVGSNNNFTPLDNAIIGQQKELAELFLKSGANIAADMELHGKILDLLNINVSEEVIANLLLTSNTIPDNIKFNILSSTPHFTKDVHHKVIDGHLKYAMEG